MKTLRDWLPLAAALVLIFHRLLLGEVIFWGAPATQFWPWREVAFGMLRAGELPLWNPLVGSGAPLIANYQSAMFYPPTWLNLIIPTEYALGLQGVLHLIWAALGMRQYVKRLGAGWLGQGVAALAFALSGYLVGRLDFTSVISTVAWLPWLLWAVDAAVREGALWRAAPLGLITGMMLLAGHAQTAFYSLVLAGCCALWLTLTLRSDFVACLGTSLLGVVLGAGLAAVQLVPTLELMRTSARSGGVDQLEALSYSFWPGRFVTLLAPNFYGTPARGDYWGFGWHWEDATFVGVVTLLLVVVAVRRWRVGQRADSPDARLSVVPFYLAVIPIAFLLAVGRHTPVYPFLFDYVPTFDLFRAPSRWSLLAVFSLSVLGGLGAEVWRPARRQGVERAIVVGLALLIAGGASAFVLAGTREATFTPATLRLGLTIVLVAGVALWRIRDGANWQTALLALLALDLATAQVGVIPTIDPAFYRAEVAYVQDLPAGRVAMLPEDERALRLDFFFLEEDFMQGDAAHWEALRTSLLPNNRQLIPAVNNDEPLPVGAFAEQMAAVEEAPPAEAVAMLGRMGASTLIAPEPRAGLQPVAEADAVTAYRIPDPWPRASLATCSGDPLECEPVEPAVITVDGAHTVVAETEGEGYLLLLDTDYPGWRATVDGEPVAIERANGAFRAVALSEEGPHTVRFTYEPLSVRIGSWVSGVSALLLGVAAAVRRPDARP